MSLRLPPPLDVALAVTSETDGVTALLGPDGARVAEAREAHADLTPVDEVPAQPLARTSGSGTLQLATTGDVSDPDCSRLRSLLSGGYDCVGQVGEVTLWWDSEDYSGPKGDGPARVAEAAKGLANAQS